MVDFASFLTSVDTNVLNRKTHTEIKPLLKSFYDYASKLQIDVDFNQLAEKLSTVKIDESIPFTNCKQFDYTHHNNVLTLPRPQRIIGVVAGNNNKKSSYTDYNHALLTQIIVMGMNGKEQYKAIYEGMASIITNQIIGNNSEQNVFEEQEIIANSLGCISNLSNLFSFCFQNEKPLMDELSNYYIPSDLNDLFGYISFLNDREDNRVFSGIEFYLINGFFAKENRTLEEIEFFERNLKLDKPHKLKDRYINNKEYFEQIKGDYLKPKVINEVNTVPSQSKSPELIITNARAK